MISSMRDHIFVATACCAILMRIQEKTICGPAQGIEEVVQEYEGGLTRKRYVGRGYLVRDGKRG